VSVMHEFIFIHPKLKFEHLYVFLLAVFITFMQMSFQILLSTNFPKKNTKIFVRCFLMIFICLLTFILRFEFGITELYISKNKLNLVHYDLGSVKPSLVINQKNFLMKLTFLKPKHKFLV